MLRKSTFIYFALILIYSQVCSQPPVQWEKSFGGSQDDWANSIIQTRDSGYIFTGFTNSSDGDVSLNHGGFDCWVVKLDSQGNLIWEKSYGGTAGEMGNSILQLDNGDYLVSGYTNSNDGDVSGNHGNSDFWLFKIDSVGNLLWQKCFGGSLSEVSYSMIKTTDEGFLLVGNSTSSNGDVASNNGSVDFWAIKVDSSGNLEWENNFGGTDGDDAKSVIQKDNGNFVIAGLTMSNNIDVTYNHGYQDFWVVEIDSTGNLLSQRTYGGTGADFAYGITTKMLSNGSQGIAIGGYSQSNDGDVTGNHGGQDIWIILIDSLNNLVSEKSFGGSLSEGLAFINNESSGDVFFCGSTMSNDSDVSGNHGAHDTWMVKFDSTQSIVWQLPLGGTGSEDGHSTQQTIDDGYIIAGYATSNDGDVSFNHGLTDCWVVKLAGPSNSNFVASDLSICEGSCISFTNESQNYLSSNWFFPGAIPDTSSQQNPINICYSTPGSYDVELVVANSYGTDTLRLANYIQVNSPIIPTIVQNIDTLTCLYSLSYQWLFYGDTVPGATNQTLITSQEGIYSVIVIDSNGCQSTSALFDFSTGIKESHPIFAISPNPVVDNLSIQSIGTNSNPNKFKIISTMGIVYKEGLILNNLIDVSDLPAQVYYLKISTKELSSNIKFIKL